MSPLKERITDDMKAAMRARDADRLLPIRMLLAACKQREVDERIELSDADVVALVDKLIKQRKDSVAAFQLAGRADLVQKETAEIAALEPYLPARLDACAIDAAVADVVAGVAADLGRQPGPADMGRVMGAAKAALAGQADMALLSASVKRALSAPN